MPFDDLSILDRGPRCPESLLRIEHQREINQCRRNLLSALRDLPSWFEWFYPDSHTCAMGLARRARIVPPYLELHTSLGMSAFHMKLAFGRRAYGKPDREVTPDDVADRLERIFATQAA